MNYCDNVKVEIYHGDGTIEQKLVYSAEIIDDIEADRVIKGRDGSTVGRVIEYDKLFRVEGLISPDIEPVDLFEEHRLSMSIRAAA